MNENKNEILSGLFCFAIIIALIVAVAIIAGPAMQAETKQKDIIYSRVVEMVQKSGFSYNLSSPEYAEFYCKHLFCSDEKDWNTVNASLQELLEYINQTAKDPHVYIFKVNTEIPSVNSGRVTVENDILRIGIIRDTFKGKQVFDGIDIDY
jgi:hypothetical protein